ncbi:MAG: hypothetical protein U0559_07385 [Anaerolineae bacterium]
MSDNSFAIPAIHLSAFLRTLLAPLIAWSVAVVSITGAGQPGVVCMTPLAWLLATWCGVQYVRLSGGEADRFGAPLLGAILGLCLGLIFTLVSTLAMPVDPSEVGKMWVLTTIMIVGGIIVCAALCTLLARITLRRYREGRMN